MVFHRPQVGEGGEGEDGRPDAGGIFVSQDGSPMARSPFRGVRHRRPLQEGELEEDDLGMVLPLLDAVDHQDEGLSYRLEVGSDRGAASGRERGGHSRSFDEPSGPGAEAVRRGLELFPPSSSHSRRTRPRALPAERCLESFSGHHRGYNLWGGGFGQGLLHAGARDGS
jgi:hypothetical protein